MCRCWVGMGGYWWVVLGWDGVKVGNRDVSCWLGVGDGVEVGAEEKGV